MNKKFISIVIPTLNEEDNIKKLYISILGEMKKVQNLVNFELIFIDNNSNDNTQGIIKKICKNDKNVKAIFNYKNYGGIRSPYHGILQARGDAIIQIAADFQEPTTLLSELIKKWINGSKIIFLRRVQTKANFIMEILRIIYYKFLNFFSDHGLIERTTGSGLYDRSIVEQLRKIKDPYPYFRGLISELYGKIDVIDFVQEKRMGGITKNSFFTLYDFGMLAIVKHSKKLLRYVTISGFLLAGICFLLGIFFLIYKLLYWNSFQLGIAPIIIGVLFGISIQVVMIGVLGEFLGVILDHSRQLPHVIEKERINF